MYNHTQTLLKPLLFGLSISLCFCFGAFAQNNTTIEGDYPAVSGEDQFFIYVDSEKIDSINVKGGHFKWSGYLDGISRVKIRSIEWRSSVNLLIDTGNYVLKIDTVTSFFLNPATRKKNYYQKFQLQPNNALQIQNDCEQLRSALEELDKAKALGFSERYQKQKNLIREIVKKYPTAQAGRILYKSSFQDYVFKLFEVDTLKQFFYASDTVFQNSEWGQKKLAHIEKMALSEMGKPLAEMTGQTPDGSSYSISQNNGEYVLIDFWASWCKPCRAEGPLLRKLYETYQNENFEIVTFSLDTDLSKWKKAIAKDSLNWAHFSDLKGWKEKNSLAHNFGIERIPYAILIDPQGIVIDKGLHGDAIKERISSILD